MTIRDALQLKPFSGTLSNGVPFVLRRPSALDLVEAVEFAAANPNRLHAWFVLRHLMENGAPVFASLDEVLQCDAHLVTEIAKAVEQLYGEGRE